MSSSGRKEELNETAIIPPQYSPPPWGRLVAREACDKALVITVNGRRRAYKGPPFKRLLDVLREDFGLTGAKEGCGEGECGACTVLLDHAPVASCLVPASQAEGRRVDTVESLARSKALSPLQKSFMEEAASQCGICTPGILLTAWSWVKSGGSADPQAIREYLSGNLCRCTGYQSIVDAVVKTVRRSKKESLIRRQVSPHDYLPPRGGGK
ncbi:MAG: (2Fe-2S)-binding protein [Elusimicrobia bacterium]|nr:(2Fe-2S)-binding protein [Elusimicrobiota bacterium]